jgi:hypothetical protein
LLLDFAGLKEENGFSCLVRNGEETSLDSVLSFFLGHHFSFEAAVFRVLLSLVCVELLRANTAKDDRDDLGSQLLKLCAPVGCLHSQAALHDGGNLLIFGETFEHRLVIVHCDRCGLEQIVDAELEISLQVRAFLVAAIPVDFEEGICLDIHDRVEAV